MRKQHPTHYEISIQAHELWRKRGCGDGDDLADWFRAERVLLCEHGKTAWWRKSYQVA